MSIEENKALMRRVIEEVFNKKNLAVADELIDTNFVHHGTVEPDFKGPEGFKQFCTMFFTAFPDIHLTIEDMIAEGDRIVLRLTARGAHKDDFMGIVPTGKQFVMSGIVINRVVGGKALEAWLVNDMLSMMQQIGAVPSISPSVAV